MKFKTTWGLLAVLALLGAYFYFVDQPRERASQAAREREETLLGDFEPTRVTEIAAQGAHGSFRLKKGERDRWSVLEPAVDVADDGKIRSLLEDLKALKTEKEVAKPGSDLKPFGLDHPAMSLDLGQKVGKLTIGAETPSGEGRYVQKAGGAVQVVNGASVAGLLLRPDDVRSKEIVQGFPWDRLRAVEVTGASTVKLTRAGGRWRLESPVALEADPDAAEAVTEKLRWGRIKRFLSWSPAEIEPRLSKGLTVSLTADGGTEPTVVRIAELDGAVVGVTQGRSAVYALEKDVLAGLRKTPEQLRRRKPVLTKTWSAEKLEVTARGSSVTYERVEGAWRRTDTTLKGEERDALTSLLQVLEDEKASQVIQAPGSSSPYGLDAPAAKLRLTDSQNGAQVLALGKKGALYYARSGDEGPVYGVSSAYLSRITDLLRQSAAVPVAPRNAKPAGSAAGR